MTATPETGPAMKRYRKKPVTIEAVQLVDDPALSDPGWEAIAEWCSGELRNHEIADSGEYETMLVIRTLEGDMTAIEGDWIIRGVAGEFYPCREDIFATTYEPAEGAALTAPSSAYSCGHASFLRQARCPGCGRGLLIQRHADHDPSLICRPAGYGLCEIAPLDDARRAALTEAVAAEKERIAKVAEDLGVHYHSDDGSQSAPFADFLRGASVTRVTGEEPV